MIPYLTNEGLLHRLAQKDLEPLLQRHFVKKGDKWYFEEHMDEDGEVKPFDFVPAEFRIEQLIRSILREKTKASIDKINQGLCSNLVNGMTPEAEEIDSVLRRIARKTKSENSKRDLWELRAQTSLARWQTTGGREAPKGHSEAILFLATRGIEEGFDVHVGEREASQDEQPKA